MINRLINNTTEVNPLNVLERRQLKFIPRHFTTLKINPAVVDMNSMVEWVYNNTKSRFAVTTLFDFDRSNKLVRKWVLGIEDSREMMIVSLSCPYLDRR